MSATTIMLVVLLGYLSAIFALVGVALGGFLVYRTKREPHEGLFKAVGTPGSAVAPGENGGVSQPLQAPE